MINQEALTYNIKYDLLTPDDCFRGQELIIQAFSESDALDKLLNIYPTRDGYSILGTIVSKMVEDKNETIKSQH